MSDTELIQVIERSGYYYSFEVEKVFIDKNEFLDSVYGEETL